MRASLLALLLAPVLVGVFGLGLELCLRRTYGRDPLYGLLLTFGAALVMWWRCRYSTFWSRSLPDGPLANTPISTQSSIVPSLSLPLPSAY